jgi:hypothetical protein
MNLEIARTLQMLIVGLLVYVINSSFGGYIHAWIAEKVGDSTPKDLGYKTIDPAAHFSFFWFTLMMIGLVFGQVLESFRSLPGVGQRLPISPESLTGKYAKARIVIDFFARAIAHLFLFVFFFFSLFVPLFMLLKSPELMEQWGSLASALQLLALTFYNQNMALFSIYFTFGFCRTILHFYFPDMELFSMETILFSFILWFFVSIFVTRFIVQFLFSALMYTGFINMDVLIAVFRGTVS